MRAVERFTPLDDDTIGYRVTVTDPATFTRPWTVENARRRAEGRLYEEGCHEGNYGRHPRRRAHGGTAPL
jgi:hypothetical protein